MATAATLNPQNIQGNILAGFNKDFQSFLFVSFPDGGDPRGWVAEITPDVATTEEVGAFNALFKALTARRKGGFGTVEATWMNVAFTASGLTKLGASEADLGQFDPSFRAGMLAQASAIGDVGPNAPDRWLKPLGSRDIHALILLASDDEDDLREAVLRHLDVLVEHGLRLVFRQEDRARTDLAGHEHFGFKDGVSQPGIRGFTPPNNPQDPNQGQPGQDLL